VIVSEAVEDSVESKDLQFTLYRVTGRNGLAPGRGYRDRDVAEVPTLDALRTGEGKNIGGPVLASELTVQTPNGPLTRETHDHGLAGWYQFA
jgi:hypothetical protein